MAHQDTNEHVDPETGEVLAADAKMITSMAPPVELSVVSAEINQQISTARRYPRRKDKIIAQEIVERATLNEEIAKECFYKLKRADKDVIGPSIRLAEIVRASYGNIRVASRFVGIDERVRGKAMVVVEAVAMDMQTNDAVLLSVSRSIMTSPKNGTPRMFSADMVNTTMMAAQSIAQRDATLRLVPKALWVDAYHAAMAATRGDMNTLADRRAKALEFFKSYGISAERLFKALGIDSEQEIGLETMVDLAGMATALKEGDSVDAVLGRAAQESGAGERASGEPARNPLDDKPKAESDKPKAESDKPKAESVKTAGYVDTTDRMEAARGVAEKTQPQASKDVGKADNASGTRAEPAGATSSEAAVQQRAEPKPEQAATADEAGPSYEQVAQVAIAQATNASKLRKWWKESRPDREEAELSSAALAGLQERYEAKLDAIEGRG